MPRPTQLSRPDVTSAVSITAAKKQKTSDEYEAESSASDSSMDRVSSHPGPLSMPMVDNTSADAQDEAATPIAAILTGIKEMAFSAKSPTSSICEGNEADDEAGKDLAGEGMDESALWEQGAFKLTGIKTLTRATVKITLSKTEDGQVNADFEADSGCDDGLVKKIEERITCICANCNLSTSARKVDVNIAWKQASELLEEECRDILDTVDGKGPYAFEVNRVVSDFDDETCALFATALTEALVSLS